MPTNVFVYVCVCVRACALSRCSAYSTCLQTLYLYSVVSVVRLNVNVLFHVKNDKLKSGSTSAICGSAPTVNYAAESRNNRFVFNS